MEKSQNNIIALKIGGSFLIKDGKPQIDDLVQMASVVKSIVQKGIKVIVIVGGGVTARDYISAGNALGVNAGVKDFWGILVSRLNARVFIEALNDDKLVYSEPAESLQQVRAAIGVKDVVVLGGLQPGQSTTAVAALCAEYCNADRVIYATDVDGVYTADPRKDPGAQKLDQVSYSKLRDLTLTSDNILPGQYRIMDGVALTILERSNIHAVILKGDKDSILRSVNGETIGTTVVP